MAAKGNKDALRVILDFKKNSLLISSALSALEGAITNNISEAVSFAVDILSDPAQKPLWNSAAGLLKIPSLNGNKKAKKALMDLKGVTH